MISTTFSPVRMIIGVRSSEYITHRVLYDAGIPLHHEIIAQMVNNSLKLDNRHTYSEHTIKRALQTLTNQGFIRRVRAGVYSARGPERD